MAYFVEIFFYSNVGTKVKQLQINRKFTYFGKTGKIHILIEIMFASYLNGSWLYSTY